MKHLHNTINFVIKKGRVWPLTTKFPLMNLIQWIMNIKIIFQRCIFLLSLIPVILQAQDSASVVLFSDPNKDVKYWLSGSNYLSDYEHGYARATSDKTDSIGKWSCKIPIDKPTILNLAHMNKTIMSVLPLYLTPGCKDTLLLHDKTIEFNGTNSKYNRSLYETENFLNTCSMMLIRHNTDSLSAVSNYNEFQSHLCRKKSSIENFLRQQKLDSAFINEQLAHVGLGARMAFIFKILSLPDSLYTEDWKMQAEKEISTIIDSPYFSTFREINFLVNGLLLLNQRVSTGTTAYESMTVQNFEHMEKLFKGNCLACAWATIINDDIVINRYDPIMPELFEILNARFPKNPYSPILEPGIKKNLSFNDINADKESSGYNIIPCDSTFKSLIDAVKPFKGRVVYVNLWATWCGSCLREYTFLPQVLQKLEGKDIAFLYISMDVPKNRERWEKMIHFLKLKGNHMLASTELTECIWREFGNYIPHAIIFDKHGNLVERNAPGLEQANDLCKKLSMLVSDI